MKPRITLNTFRKIDRLHETVIRATMPKTSANDPEPLAAYGTQDNVRWTVNGPGGTRLAKKVAPLTFTLQEVARA